MKPPTAAQIAHFDQAYANRSECIDDMIGAYLAVVADDGNAELHTAGLAQYLCDHVTHNGCADLLAVAIRRLATPTPEARHV